jgi:molybdopterin converting factor small subunit
MATVIIPTPLRKFANNTARVDVTASKVSDVVDQLALSYPELKKHLVDTSGRIAPFINIFVDNKDIRNLERELTEVRENAVVCIIPAIAGGTESTK